MYLGFFVRRLVSYGARISLRHEPKNSLRTERGLLQLMAHRPIVIDGAGADGSAEGAGGVDSGPSNDHGSCGACVHQVVVFRLPLLAGAPATKMRFATV